jgi:hypothetical protein
MNKQEGSLPSEWISIARKDWKRIHRMLQYGDFEACGLFLQHLGSLGLRSEDIENGLSEAKKFIKVMFPSEILKVNE